jgi:hypothetical protein
MVRGLEGSKNGKVEIRNLGKDFFPYGWTYGNRHKVEGPLFHVNVYQAIQRW